MLTPSRYDLQAATREEYKRAMIWTLEMACDRTSDAQLTVLLDGRPGPEGAGWANTPPWTSVPLLQSVGDVLARNYPERVRRIIAYPAPSFATALFYAVKPFIDPGTARKIVLLPGDAYADSPCPAGLNDFVSMKAIRRERRPQHASLRPD